MIEPYGDSALAAVVLGFCFFMGVMMAAGLWRRTLSWTQRPRDADQEILDAGDLQIGAVHLIERTAGPASRPPPIPSRLLN